MSEGTAGAVDGNGLASLFTSAAAWLEANAAAIDAINVYPVPDGDTGSNMSATLVDAVRSAEANIHAGRYAGALSEAALFTARGNSGVILSQALRGFAEGLDDAPELNGEGLAASLTQASRRAYGAVAHPQEGTMLTVLRAASEAVSEAELPALEEALTAAVAAARAAEARTMEQLPALREAGVTDSGGEGICVILEGLLAGLRGEPAPEPIVRPGFDARAYARAHATEEWGFCTEFVIEPGMKDTDAAVTSARERMETLRAHSLVVVGVDGRVRVHLHTEDPDAAVAAGTELGSVTNVKADDMRAQAAAFAKGGEERRPLAVLAMSRGAGFDRLFASLGAAVNRMGDIVKPAAGEIARAAERLGADVVVILPNHKNVLLAAQQAVAISRCRLAIVPTRTPANGVAAMVEFDPGGDVEEVIAAMAKASSSVVSVEVTRAAATRTVDGVDVREGDYLVLIDGSARATADNALSALLEGVRQGKREGDSLITVFAGEGAVDDAAIVKALATTAPGFEVEVVAGGQSLYPYIASIE